MPTLCHNYSDFGSFVTVINGRKIGSYDFSHFLTLKIFNEFQCNSHILFCIRTEKINIFAIGQFFFKI